eukprot:TRINITY_DN101038_c0_g1_i1.p1 TRINITY_DN101038_c0_g1~~TRINITY_DN101038_c0_g1_i1.p1  ORF type:complete len:824 (-),score=213.12 TRINITY_DN101038_c0_g1_i1:120-2591(-)
MDKRLPHRVREIRISMRDSGKLCNTDSMKDELLKSFPEYTRFKQQALKRLISQELAAPLPAPEKDTAAAATAGADAEAGRDGSKKRKRSAGEAEAAEAEPATQAPRKEAESVMNNSLRKMYNPQATGEEKPAEEKPNGATAVSAKSERLRLARERQAMAAARRAAGLPDPQNGRSSEFEPLERPAERLSDLGGIDPILDDLRQLVVQPLTHPEVYAHLGVSPPTGVLLHGPPGSGKTKLAHALAGTTGVSFFKVAATEIVSGMSGESEAKIRQLFQSAIAAAPSLLFMDEVDAITPRRDSAGREMERRIVAQLLTCMDELKNSGVVVMGATNRPDALDPALRRAGRFDREIAMGIPDEPARLKILEKMTSGMRLAGDLDLKFLAKGTPGYVGADLNALTQEAALTAVVRAFANLKDKEPSKAADTVIEDAEGAFAGAVEAAEAAEASEQVGVKAYTAQELEGVAVVMADFNLALTKVQPSMRREGFTTIPDVAWEDVGALADVRGEMDAAVCEPIRKAELFRQLGLTVPCGVLLFGPPGCGKTLLAKATANASGANFISVKGPELLNKYVGESEKAVRSVFERARSSSPCVIFFDELDALVPKRTGEGSSGAERVVNQMLTEMDGVHSRAQVYVIGATNRPDIVDPAMLRPGRLDRLLFVPLPTEAGRLEILRAHAKRLPLTDDVDLPTLSQKCEGFSGADLAALVREAAMTAIRAADMPAPAPKTRVPASPTVRPCGTGAAAGPPPDLSLPEGSSAATATAQKDMPAASEKQTEEAAPLPVVRITAEMFRMARTKVSASVGPEERRDYEELANKIASGRAGS